MKKQNQREFTSHSRTTDAEDPRGRNTAADLEKHGGPEGALF